MNDAHKIVEQVYAAKEDVRAADGLIPALYQGGSGEVLKTSSHRGA